MLGVLSKHVSQRSLPLSLPGGGFAPTPLTSWVMAAGSVGPPRRRGRGGRRQAGRGPAGDSTRCPGTAPSLLEKSLWERGVYQSPPPFARDRLILFWGSAQGTALTLLPLPTQDRAGRRGEGERVRGDRPGLGAGGAGGEREGLAASVKTSLKHRTLPHTSFLCGPHRVACNNRVNRNPKRSILTSET